MQQGASCQTLCHAVAYCELDYAIDGLAVSARQRLGLRYVTDDRLGEGVVLPYSVGLNMVLKRIGEAPFWRRGTIDRVAINATARELIMQFDIRTRSEETRIGKLSGGNIQKALLARELSFDPKVVVFNKPTHGLDVRTIAMVRERIRELAAGGSAAIVISTDLDELRRAIAHADPATVRSRFLGGRPPTGDRELGRLVNLDYDRRLAVIALSPVGRGVGIARYEAESGGVDIAEVTVAVDLMWRHIGLATALVRLLAAGAVSNGIHRFSADFFDANQDVRDLFVDAGLSYQTTPAAAGVVTAEVTLPTNPADLL